MVSDAGDRKGGAGLQTSTQRSTKKLLGSSGWTDVAFDFETQDGMQGDFGFMSPIQDESPEIELNCELRAAKGDAWFDRDSLRLVRR